MIDDKELKRRILKILKDDTLIKSSTGFLYLFDAIYECFKDKSMLENMYKKLFVKIAEREDTKPEKIDRVIRYCISTSSLGKTITEVILTALLLIETD